MDQGKGIDSWDRNMQGTQKTVHGTIPWIKGSGLIVGTGTCKGHRRQSMHGTIPWIKGRGLIVGTGTCKGHRRQSMGQSHGSREADG